MFMTFGLILRFMPFCWSSSSAQRLRDVPRSKSANSNTLPATPKELQGREEAKLAQRRSVRVTGRNEGAPLLVANPRELVLEVTDLLRPPLLISDMLLELMLGRLDRQLRVRDLLPLVLDIPLEVGELVVERG